MSYRFAKKGKIICPRCERKTFVPYVNTDGKILNEKVGKCDRADNCGYHYSAWQYFKDNKEIMPVVVNTEPYVPPKPTFIDSDIYLRSLGGYHINTLAIFLAGIYGKHKVEDVFRAYNVGTTSQGDCIFWQVDEIGRVRTGKVMKYLPNGKRDKKNFGNWVHSMLKLDNFVLEQCMFGNISKAKECGMVNVFESEKTALIQALEVYKTRGEIYFNYLACGGCEGINDVKLRPFKDNMIHLHPDKGMEWKWIYKKSKHLDYRIDIIHLEDDLPDGTDRGDIILNQYGK